MVRLYFAHVRAARSVVAHVDNESFDGPMWGAPVEKEIRFMVTSFDHIVSQSQT